MKNMKKAILFILVLNLIAMLAGIGWLFSSGRVNKERVLELTQLFEEPVAIEQAHARTPRTRRPPRQRPPSPSRCPNWRSTAMNATWSALSSHRWIWLAWSA